MAHSKQARKRSRQNERDRQTNRIQMSALKTAFKAFETALQAGDAAATKAAATKVIQTIDKAAQGKVIHKNNAARKKSQVMRKITAAAK